MTAHIESKKEEIAKRVLGENIEVTIPGREKGFFAKLKSLFRK